MELYDAKTMPLASDPKKRAIQEKVKNGEQLTMMEKLSAGRDHVIKSFDDYQFKSDHVYRAISEAALLDYKQQGFIRGFGDDDEYKEYEENGQLYNNNAGVDWYLGGACLRYGEIIIECPADKEYFQPAFDNGNHLCADPDVKHFKSSGSKNPVPFSMVSKVIDTRKLTEEKSFTKRSETEKREYDLIKEKNRIKELQKQQELNNTLTKKYTNGFANGILLSIIAIVLSLIAFIIAFSILH